MPTSSRAPGPPRPTSLYSTPTASRICFPSRASLNNKCLSLSAFSVWWKKKKKSRGLRRMETPRAGAARSSRSSRSCYSSTLETTPVVDIRRCTIHSPGGQLAQCKMDYSAFTRAHSRVFFPLPSYVLCCRKGASDFFETFFKIVFRKPEGLDSVKSNQCKDSWEFLEKLHGTRGGNLASFNYSQRYV